MLEKYFYICQNSNLPFPTYTIFKRIEKKKGEYKVKKIIEVNEENNAQLIIDILLQDEKGIVAIY